MFQPNRFGEVMDNEIRRRRLMFVMIYHVHRSSDLYICHYSY